MKTEIVGLDQLPKLLSRKGKYIEIYRTIEKFPSDKVIHLKFDDADEKKKMSSSLFARKKQRKLPVTILGTGDGSLDLWIVHESSRPMSGQPVE